MKIMILSELSESNGKQIEYFKILYIAKKCSKLFGIFVPMMLNVGTLQFTHSYDLYKF